MGHKLSISNKQDEADTNEVKYPVVETFLSVDGEGVRTGLPVVFVRFYGCNLRCSYCDTPYSYDQDKSSYRKLTNEELTNEIMKYNCHRVTFTGGEPLLFKDYILWFASAFPYMEVNIETNGTMPISPFLPYKNVIITMDWKCISSGQTDKMLYGNLIRLREHDVLKFVVGTDEDLNQAKKIIESQQSLVCNIYFSPVFGQMELPKLAEYVISMRHYRTIRIGLQIHKFIWDPNLRGV